MAKRFTDTLKYKKPFFRGLQGAYKLLWDYLYHDCDHAGIWIVDFDIAQLYIGADMKICRANALENFNSDEVRIVEIDNGKKWFIPSFISFQYGQLSEKNRAHINVISQLVKYDLLNDDLTLKILTKPLTSPLQGAKEQEEEKEQEKEKEKDNWQKFVDCWFDFYEKRVGVKPKFDGSQASALKSIKKHLEDVSQNPVEAWGYILQNWNKLDDWMQNQTDLKIINSKFNNILNTLKNGSKKSGGQVDTRSAFSKIDDFYSKTRTA